MSFFFQKLAKLVKFTLVKHISPKRIYQFIFLDETSKVVKKKNHHSSRKFSKEKNKNKNKIIIIIIISDRCNPVQ